MTLVLVRLLSDDPSPIRVAGALVEFYNTSAVFQTSGTTDTNGEVQVTLPDADYDLMFFKMGVSILPKQPQRITVDTLLTNHFEITGHVRTRPESTDLRRCTISGYILGVGGGDAVHRLIFEPLKLLLVNNFNVIAPYHRIEFTSDETGYFQFELLRNTKYNGYFVWPQDLFQIQPGRLDIITPDAPAAALDSLLFPLPINTVFSASTISLTLGTPADTSVTVMMSFTDGSDRTVYATPWAGVAVTTVDATVVQASLRDGFLFLLPMKAGTTTVTTIRDVPDSVSFDPLPAYTSDTLTVTVS